MQGPETENNNDHQNEAMAESGRAWQFICIRKGSVYHAKCHGLDVPTGWNTMGPAASERCEDTFHAKPNVKEIFVTHHPATPTSGSCRRFGWKAWYGAGRTMKIC